MEIRFCDLCNESVPMDHLALGRAHVRKGRVICASCEEAMSGAVPGLSAGGGARGGEPLDPSDTGPIDTLAAGPFAAHDGRDARPAAAPVAGGSGGGAALWLALVAIVFAAGGSAIVVDLLGQQREEGREGQLELSERIDGLGTRIELLGERLTNHGTSLEASLRQGLEDGRRDLGEGLARVRGELERGQARVDALDERLRGIEQQQAASRSLLEARVAELSALAERSHEDVDYLLDRVAELERVVQGGIPVAGGGGGAAAPAAPEPSWKDLLPDLASKNGSTRWTAVHALGESGDPGVVPHLAPVLQDEDVFVRMAVCIAFGKIASLECVEPLLGALEDEESAVRENAVVALRAITGRNFQFDPLASPAERAKRVKAWTQWWRKAREELGQTP